MHATYTTLKNFTVTLGMCLVVLSFCASSAWAQSDTKDKSYDRLARVKATTSIDGVSEQPSQVALVSSYPNPFNPEATIRFDVRKSQQVRLSVFNELGQQVMVLVNGLDPWDVSRGAEFLRELCLGAIRHKGQVLRPARQGQGYDEHRRGKRTAEPGGACQQLSQPL